MPEAATAVSPGVQEALGAVEGFIDNLGGLWGIARVLALLVGCLLVSRVLMALLGRALNKSRLDRSLHTVIKSLVRLALGFVTILIVADAVGIPVTSLLAVFSIMGLALSLAVQGVLGNFAGGIMLLWAKPFQVGDTVEVDGVVGRVADITLVHTKLVTPDNRVVYLTNKAVSEAKVVNLTGEETRRVELTITASYDSPVERVKGALMEAITHTPGVLTDPAPLARVGGYGASAIEYHVRAWCAAGDYWAVYYDLHEEIKAAFDRSGVEMTYDHLNVHVLEDGQKA